MKTLNFLWVFLAALMMQSCQGQSPCTYQGGNLDYLSKITCNDDYNILAGKPLTEKYGQVKSIKLIFRLKNKHLYFAESKKYPLHFRFCQEVLNDNQSLYGFNKGNYYNSINRQYILANLNYYSALNIYCLEFFNGDEVTAPQIKMLFDSLVSKAPILASRLKLLINTPEIESRHLSISSIPFINVNTIYEHQTYQTLTKGIAYGYLRVIDKKAFKKFVFNKHDIIITNTIPNTLPVVAGVITVPFQTPLCHISVLCANRKTPNAAYRLAFTDKQILKLENKLVRFEVFADSFTITDATAELKKIELVWKKEENKKKIKLAFDLKTSGILAASKIIYSDSKTVGGKAANFGELDKIRLANKKVIPLPESAFAIPFYWYHQHLLKYGIKAKLDSILANPQILNNTVLLDKKLKEIRKLIKISPLDPKLIKIINAQLTQNGKPYKNFRFRSSTNAEDIKGFNGAGLYTSKTVTLGDSKKTIEKAVRQVWASLWDERAFAERAYFNFDQSSVYMAILVHRAFGDEAANGVAITKHLYRENYPAYTLNIQKGETSVVAPPDSVICDQIIVGLGIVSDETNLNYEFISKSNISGGKPVLNQKQLAELVQYLTAIKSHFFSLEPGVYMNNSQEYENFAMDVEFKIDKTTGNLYIKQARNY